MWSLGFPLAISFFCRYAMTSTDNSFIGHIHSHDKHHTNETETIKAETFMAAAVLSDMVVTLVTVPPLAFNQVLNALVGQAIGSNHLKMAGVWYQQSVIWLTLTMIPCLIGCFYVEEILVALGFPLDIAKLAGVYGVYNVFWPIPDGLYKGMRFYFQAQGIPLPAMYNNILFLFINALLNYIFVMGGPFQWEGLGFVGAAISLSLSRTLQPLIYALYMFVYKKHHLPTWPGLSLSHHTKDRTKEFLRQSIPCMGTTIFQSISSQVTTLLIGQLGENAIAASSAVSTIFYPVGQTLLATAGAISSVRVGYHLGKGNGEYARQSSWMVIYFLTIVNVVIFVIFILIQDSVLDIVTDDEDVVQAGIPLIVPMLITTYFSLIVSNVTSGVFSGMGRPVVATILSFGFELPASIGVVAWYILKCHGTLLGVYWLGAITAAVEAVVVMIVFGLSNWDKYACKAQERQEACRRDVAMDRDGVDGESSGDLEDGGGD